MCKALIGEHTVFYNFLYLLYQIIIKIIEIMRQSIHIAKAIQWLLIILILGVIIFNILRDIFTGHLNHYIQ